MPDRFELVPFEDRQIMTVQRTDGIYVVMKPIVEALGIPWEGQRQRIQRHPVLAEGTCIIQVPSLGGMQDAMALALEHFHGWLVTVSADRVKDEAKRDMIVAYQRRAFRVIFEHFHGKIGAPRLNAGSVSAQIALEKHYLALGRKLMLTTDPAERQMVYGLITRVAEQLGQTPPALADMGREAPRPPEMLATFWTHVATIEAAGDLTNYHRDPRKLAYRMSELRAAFAKHRIRFPITKDVREALRRSKAPKFEKMGAVNSAIGTGKTQHCWIFERVADASVDQLAT